MTVLSLSPVYIGISVSLGGGVISTAQGSNLVEQGGAIAKAAETGGASGAAAASGIRVSVSIGSSTSESSSTTNTNTSAGSNLRAGGDINIQATNGNLTTQGATITANNNVSLSATENVNLLASVDTESSRSKNSSSSTSVGVSFGIGGQSTGLSLDISAMRGRGQANSDSTIYNNTNVTAGNTLNIQSGGNTNLIGATVSGNTVNANVGGNLTIQSLQDTATSSASQSTTGVSVSIPIYGTGGSASISQTRQNSNSNYQSVNQQSGIQAGDGGFNITVGGNTNLVGATIGSTANASAAGNNSLTTATLTTSDIQNQATASASSSGTSIGTNMMSGYGAAKGVIGNLMNRGSASSNDASTTTSAISGATVTVGTGANVTTTNTAAGQTLTSTNGNVVASNTSSTNRVLAKPDTAGLQAAAQQNQADSVLLFTTLSAFADIAQIKSAAPKKVYLLTCDSAKNCTQTEVDPSQVKAPNGTINVYNNGMFNNTSMAIEGAIAQSSNEALAQGVYVVANPETNNPISALMYAAYAKLNEMTGLLPTSSAAQTNLMILQVAQQLGVDVNFTNHSLGNLTFGEALQQMVQNGATNLNVGTVQMNGAAANSQRTADFVHTVSGGTGVVQQSTAVNDIVGTLVGGNAPTGGNTSSSMLNSHTNYGPNANPITATSVWGSSPSTSVIVPPNNTLTPSAVTNANATTVPAPIIPYNTNANLQQQHLQQQVQSNSNAQMNNLQQNQNSITSPTQPPTTNSNSRTQQLNNFLKGQ